MAVASARTGRPARSGHSLFSERLKRARDLCAQHARSCRDETVIGVYCESAWQIPVLSRDD
jgi:hypothetical protein